MSRTLTKDDLNDIRGVVEEALDPVMQQVAAGFEEVHTKIDDLRLVINRIDQVQQAELYRNDRQDADIKRIRKALHAA